MPLKWFGEWTEANPVNIWLPAFAVGIPGGALVVVALLVANDVRPPDDTLQTGPRGTGMHVYEDRSDLEDVDPEIQFLMRIDTPPVLPEAVREDAALDADVGPLVLAQAEAVGDAASIVDDPLPEADAPMADAAEEAPAPPADEPEIAQEQAVEEVLPGAVTALDYREPLLDVLTDENYTRLVTAMREWTGIPNLLDGSDNYQNAVALQMIQMTQSINSDWEGHVSVNEQVGVTCYTCHRGQPVPSGIWFEGTPVTLATEGWASVQNRATALSQSTSLPSDALYQYLVEGGQITVHDLESRVSGSPADGIPSIQDTERTFSLMNYFANSLGVNCTFCHNTRAFYDVGQVTPQWATASLGIAMVLELNDLWILPIAGILPPERLGPLGDGPKLACNTCHKGAARPLGGTNVIGNWPELASPEPPVYEPVN